MNRMKKCFVVTVLLCQVTLFVGSFPASAGGEKVSDAEKHYENGMAAYKEQRWSIAAREFRASYELLRHLLTAYMLSCAYVQSEDPWSAEEFAHFALEGEPRLDEPYASKAREIIQWARAAKEDEYYKIIAVPETESDWSN